MPIVRRASRRRRSAGAGGVPGPAAYIDAMRSNRSEAAATVEIQCEAPGTPEGTAVPLSVRRPEGPAREVLRAAACPKCGRALTLRVLSRGGMRRRRLLHAMWTLVFLAVILLDAGVAYLIWPSLQGPGFDRVLYRSALWAVIEAGGIAIAVTLWRLFKGTGVTLAGEADGPPPVRGEPGLHRIEE